MFCEPTPQHAFLAALAGDWTYEGECSMGPDQPWEKNSGKESGRTLGDLWLLLEGEVPMQEGAVGKTLFTLGYDVAKQRFTGTFVGSMMSNLWVYDGELDASGTALCLYADGPCFSTPGETQRYRDTISIREDGSRTLTSEMQGPDGSWTCFMRSRYTRV